jgi:hypothetical protein
MSDDDFLGELGTSKVRPGELSALAQSDMITTHTHQVPPSPFSIHYSFNPFQPIENMNRS